MTPGRKYWEKVGLDNPKLIGVSEELESAIVKGIPFEEGISLLLSTCERYRPNPVWKRLRALEYSEDFKHCLSWLRKVLKDSPPPDSVNALAFIVEPAVEDDEYEAAYQDLTLWGAENFSLEDPEEAFFGSYAPRSNHASSPLFEKIWRSVERVSDKLDGADEMIIEYYAGILAVNLCKVCATELAPSSPERRRFIVWGFRSSETLLGEVTSKGLILRKLPTVPSRGTTSFKKSADSIPNMELERLLLSDRPLSESAIALAEWGQRQVSHVIWKEMRSLDFAADLRHCLKWLNEVVRRSPPGSKVNVFNFQLGATDYERDSEWGCYDLFLIGGENFKPDREGVSFYTSYMPDEGRAYCAGLMRLSKLFEQHADKLAHVSEIVITIYAGLLLKHVLQAGEIKELLVMKKPRYIVWGYPEAERLLGAVTSKGFVMKGLG